MFIYIIYIFIYFFIDVPDGKIKIDFKKLFKWPWWPIKPGMWCSEAAKKTTFEVKTTFFDCFQLSLFEKRFSFDNVAQHIMHTV